IVYFLISRRFLRRNSLSLSNLLILGIIYQIPLHGVFYYSFWTKESSVCIIITLILAKYLKSSKKYLN
ncbi:MAG: hypothetical protein VB122_07245, partial [Erysipelotrichales bacterium]|nr:hypothetical protein [Erysipelotrichales bacterium]